MSFTYQEKVAIWNKALPCTGKDPNVIRVDKYGAFIKWLEYGDESSEINLGWQVDHIDGNKENKNISNLQPLHWKNNNVKSNQTNPIQIVASIKKFGSWAVPCSKCKHSLMDHFNTTKYETCLFKVAEVFCPCTCYE